MREEKIYLDQKGYQDYLVDIEKLKEELNQNNRQKSSAYDSGVGDGWHDNFDFEHALREEFKIMGLLKKKMDDLEKIVIIEKDVETNRIGLDDYVKVKLFMNDEEDEFSFKLIASLSSKEDEISINSPMGRAIYKKRIGDKISYQVGDALFVVEILSKK